MASKKRKPSAGGAGGEIQIVDFGPVALPDRGDYVRADLEFFSIDHFRPSFSVHLFFNDETVDETSYLDDRPSFAGRFSIFGHDVCTGDEGHCDAHRGLRRFDRRPSHPLTRAFKRVTVTNALREVQREWEDLVVTAVVAAEPSDERYERLLDCAGVQLVTFD
jgi:hypothetical protein